MSDESEIREALEKQEAQKVEYVSYENHDGEYLSSADFDEERCPRCHNDLDGEYSAIWMKYCPYCGQKINWGLEDEEDDK